ncbi:MAG: endonuclease/exonuclease/phosphatase family protein [Synergistales bacterium]|nr:endonuclease/exonuclease/phosphatase family protein [Synergistales bacterium]
MSADEVRAPVLRTVTYNLYQTIRREGRYSVEQVPEVLREIRAGIIGLQEVELHGWETAELPHFLEALPGMEVIFGPTILWRRSGFGNVLVSAYPVREVKRYDISVRTREPRGAIDALVDTEGQTVRVVVTHLGLRAGERAEQVEMLLEILRSGSGDPTLLMGDCNGWHPTKGGLQRLTTWFTERSLRRTFPARLPLLPLDRIYLRSQRYRLRCYAHRSRLSRRLSDHLPLVGELLPVSGG